MTFDSDYEPFFQPPGWIIGPIWSVLYVMLAISLYTTIVNRSEINYRNIAIALFVIQMIANLMWPRVFDDAKYLQSLLLIVVMVLLTIVYAYLTYGGNKQGSMLVWPYIAWVTFAGIINVAYYLHAD
ncbi:MAG: hypothetical protein CMB51_07270 [Euryarchaeota archaeon]|nr:hypothetical protein [Euryarchaeota archaeon]MBK55699.1 hypothetical protein [Euryarchaeota archaeon]